ncbi:MAG: dTDP-4-dehydrorhamnose reductase [Phycisphaerales bacterium]|nr:dTDP-4-dehydrorhamnose reductase [Phycisphaerales bacterium]
MKTPTRVIVLGAGGQFGRQIVNRLGDTGAWDVQAYERRQLDITDRDRLRQAIVAGRPAWVVNAAAFTNVDACESQADSADRVNARAVADLAAISDESGAALLHISTDYVFDGRSAVPYREDDPPAPISTYGRSKMLGEQSARHATRHLIVRAAWLYGPGGRNFIDAILARAETGQPLRVVNDQRGNPSNAADMAECVERLMRLDATGLYHIVNGGTTTRYELACRAIELAGLSTPVEAVVTAAYPTPAARPANSALDASKYETATGHQPRHWSLALAEYVVNRRAATAE